MATAWHEAGHAVMAALVGRPIQKVTITPANLQTGGVRLGAVKIQKGRAKSSRDPLEDEVLILLAGMVAEARFTENYCRRGAASDLRSVRRLLETRANSDRQLEKLEQRMLNKAEHLLHEPENIAAIESVANELVSKQSISGRAVVHLLKQAQDAQRKADR